jgi:hypothetical protein
VINICQKQFRQAEKTGLGEQKRRGKLRGEENGEGKERGEVKKGIRAGKEQ